MPALAFHWDLGKKTGLFRADGGDGAEARLDFIMNLMSRANIRLRCWPSVETLMEDTGFSNKTVAAAAIKWLFEHGAIYNVPTDKRIGEEAKLSARKYVFQLTGIICLGDEVYPYILMKAEERASMIEELKGLGAEYAVSLYGTESVPDEEMDGTDTVGTESGGVSSTILSGSSLHTNSTPVAVPPSRKSRNPLYDHYRPTPAAKPTEPEKKKIGFEEEDLQHGLVKLFMETCGVRTLTLKHIKLLHEGFSKRSEDVKHSYPSMMDMWDNNPIFQEFCKTRFGQWKAAKGGDVSPTPVLLNLQNVDKRVEEGSRQWQGFNQWAESHKVLGVVHQEFPTGFVPPESYLPVSERMEHVSPENT